MTFKIVVIDDESIEDLISNLNLESFSHEQIKPESFQKDIESITNEYDLILMDQKLAGNIGKIPYMGTTLVQELRTRMAENKLTPKPVILWSIAGNISSYQNEKSSHNLVDAVWNKECLHHSNTLGREECARKIESLVFGYRKLNSVLYMHKSEGDGNGRGLAAEIFGIKPELVQGYLPESVLGHLVNKNHHVTHTLSIFLTNAILRFNGFLINEQTLAARCGVDIKCDEWGKLKGSHLKPFKFDGIYSDFYPRWWASEFETWWLENISDEHPANLEAEQRVELLNQKLSLSLSTARPADNHLESKFWHCCIINDAPLDEIDSYKVTTSERREWQEQLYASFNAINNKLHKSNGYELTARDKERFLKVRKGNDHE
ncbi:MAG: response regulator transcription factor [Bacterioplanes sp.]|nr:response regulator transcription factor [Bacterioplanes sp.]